MSDQLLPRELLPAGPPDADWDDVLRRARQRNARGGLWVLLAVALIAVGVASAYALGHPIVDFSKAERGPTKIVNSFGSLEVGAPPGMAPGVLPHEARKVTSVRMDGTTHVLWVAPTKQGGFCELWTHSVGGCRADRHDDFATHIGVSMIGGQTQSGLRALVGSFFQSAGERLEVTYADGSAFDIPFVWVTAPIDAGFYFYRVPHDAPRPTAVVLYDDDGTVVTREPLPDVLEDAARSRQVQRRIRGYAPLSVPAAAEWDERRQLFDVHAADGAHLGLWVAPARGGGECFWTNQAAGCPPTGFDRSTMPPLALGLQAGGKHMALCCGVGPGVARVEARFEDGDRAELRPKEQYLLWAIPPRHYPVGHRLNQMVAFDAAGRRLAGRNFSTRTRGVYPCANPKSYPYEVSMCP